MVRAMSEPAGLNFLDDRSRDTWVARITGRSLFQGLLDIDPVSYALTPQLATAYTQSADHRTTTFTLRRGVRFHDGAPFTAADVVAVLSAVKDPARPTRALAAELEGLESFRALDDFTLELRWSRPSPFALRQLARLPIYPKAAVAAWDGLARNPLGTGPFRLESWAPGERIVLTRAPGAWSQAFLDRIEFRLVKEHTLATALFEQGAFDLMTNLQGSVWRALELPTPENAWAWRDYHRVRFAENAWSFVAWNARLPLFEDPKVRRALAHLYPSERVSKVVDLGLELPTTCPFFLGSAQCDPTVTALPYDRAAARALLADAGFRDADGDGVLERDGQPLRFRFAMPPTAVRLAKLAPLLQEEFAQVGIAMELDKVDGAVLSQRVTRFDFEALSRVWTELDVEQDTFALFHSSQADAGSNLVGYRSPEADRLLEAIRAEFDPQRRQALERALHRRLYADQPYLWMTARQSLDAARTRVHGLVPSLTWYDLTRVWVDP